MNFLSFVKVIKFNQLFPVFRSESPKRKKKDKKKSKDDGKKKKKKKHQSESEDSSDSSDDSDASVYVLKLCLSFWKTCHFCQICC